MLLETIANWDDYAKTDLLDHVRIATNMDGNCRYMVDMYRKFARFDQVCRD
jgi:hypothetical protein